MNRARQDAFTFAEVAVSFSLVALLATLMYPMLVNNVGKDAVFAKTKDAVSQIQMAYSSYATNPGIDPATTTIASIMLRMPNFVRIRRGGPYFTQVIEGSVQKTTWCTTRTPCVVLANGALLQYDSDVTFGNSLNPENSAAALILDPDGKLPQVGIPLVLYLRGRISVNTVGTPVYDTAKNNLPLGTENPEYLNSLLYTDED